MKKTCRKLLLAHRGYTKKFQENTLESIQEAINNKYTDGLEFDVMPTLDDIPVCFHDENMTRLIGINKRIDQITYHELSKLKIKNKIGNNIEYSQNPKIPKFSEALNILKDTKKVINLELKYDKVSTKFVNNVVNLISEYKMEDKIIISSFNPDLLKLIDSEKFILANINDYDICENDISKMNLDYSRVVLDKRSSTDLIKELKKRNKIIGIYTINSYNDNLKDNFDDFNVDYLIFDQLFD